MAVFLPVPPLNVDAASKSTPPIRDRFSVFPLPPSLADSAPPQEVEQVSGLRRLLLSGRQALLPVMVVSVRPANVELGAAWSIAILLLPPTAVRSVFPVTDTVSTAIELEPTPVSATVRLPRTSETPTVTPSCAPWPVTVTKLAVVVSVPPPNRAVLPTPVPRFIVTPPATCAF